MGKTDSRPWHRSSDRPGTAGGIVYLHGVGVDAGCSAEITSHLIDFSIQIRGDLIPRSKVTRGKCCVGIAGDVVPDQLRRWNGGDATKHINICAIGYGRSSLGRRWEIRDSRPGGSIKLIGIRHAGAVTNATEAVDEIPKRRRALIKNCYWV